MSFKFRIALSLACAVLAALIFLSYGDHIRADAEQVRSEAIARYGGEIVSIVVSNRTLEAGETISAADVTQCDWVADLVPEGAFTNLDEVIGKGVTVPIAKGAPVCDLNFRTNDEQLEVPQGMVAVSVPLTDRTGVPVEVVAGSNVIAYATSDEGTTLVTEDVVVLSMPESSSIGAAATLTLAVSPDAVPVVLTASAEGTLRIVVPADDVDNTAGAVQADPSVPAVEEGETNG